MKTFQEFLTEAKKQRYKDALASYADQQNKKSKTDKILAKETEAGSKERKVQVRKGLLPAQGGGAVRKDQRIKADLARATSRAIKKGKDPNKVRAQIAAATAPTAHKPYTPGPNYDPSSRPAPGTVTAHDGTTKKANWSV